MPDTGGAGGPFALIQPWLSGKSAQDKLRDYYNQQALANAGAVAGDPNAPFSGQFATPPTGQPAKPPPMGLAPPGPNEPKSTQTPESYGSLLMDLQQQNEAEAGFNKSIGLGLSAFAQPRSKEALVHAFDPSQPKPDPFRMGESIMNSMSMQQGQDRANQIARLVNDPTQGPLIAQRMNVDWGTLKAGIVTDPGMVSKIATVMGTPTEKMRDLTQIDNYIAQVQQRDPGKSPEVLTMIRSAMLAGMGGPQAEAAIGDAVAYKARTGKDAPWVANGVIDQRAYNQFAENEKAKEVDRGNAAHTLADNETAANELRTGLESIRDNPALEGMLNNPAKRALVQSIMKDPDATDVPSIIKKYALNNDEAQVIATLRRITGQSTANALHSLVGTGTRVTQQEVGPLKDAISTVLNFNQDYDNYIHNSLNPFITKIKKTVANTYGASGNLAHMDPELEPWLHPIYRKGGELFKEGGGAENIPDLGPAPPEKIAQAKGIIADHPFMKEDLLDNLQQQGFDVSKLRHQDPSKW